MKRQLESAFSICRPIIEMLTAYKKNRLGIASSKPRGVLLAAHRHQQADEGGVGGLYAQAAGDT